VLIDMLVPRYAGISDVEGNVLLRHAVGEFLNVKAAHYEGSRPPALKDHRSEGSAKLPRPKHRSEQKALTHVQPPDRFRRG
jgi:hypothetical protein